jgi:hypothetical protein
MGPSSGIGAAVCHFKKKPLKPALADLTRALYGLL